MNWLLFYLLAALHPIAFLLIGFKSKTWRQRLLLWVLLPIPAVLYCWDYYAIKNEHALMCAAEGGLKVLIQPEKTDRVRFVGDSYGELEAQATLETYYPRMQYVETMTDAADGISGKRFPYYVAYSAIPNPKAGQPMDKAPWTERKLIYTITRIESPDPTIFEISVHESPIPHGTRTETRLSKAGAVHAKYTRLVHWWTGIQYPDALPTWRCPDMSGPDPIGLPYDSLTKLILK